VVVVVGLTFSSIRSSTFSPSCFLSRYACMVAVNLAAEVEEEEEEEKEEEEEDPDFNLLLEAEEEEEEE
jgi:hypothetical protein